MEKLEFSTNWNNKLDCKCFTTIRIYNLSKHFRGNQFEIFLQKKFKTKPQVLGTILTKLDELSDYVCYLDTGYNREQTTAILKKMYPHIDFKKQKICIVLLERIDPVKPVQKTLFN
jgi:hypothetical protein